MLIFLADYFTTLFLPAYKTLYMKMKKLNLKRLNKIGEYLLGNDNILYETYNFTIAGNSVFLKGRLTHLILRIDRENKTLQVFDMKPMSLLLEELEEHEKKQIQTTKLYK